MSSPKVHRTLSAYFFSLLIELLQYLPCVSVKFYYQSLFGEGKIVPQQITKQGEKDKRKNTAMREHAGGEDNDSDYRH